MIKYQISAFGVKIGHFCIRAAVLGFDLFVDTHSPAFHVYRCKDLAKAKLFKVKNRFEDIDWSAWSVKNEIPDYRLNREVNAEDILLIEEIQKNIDSNNMEHALDLIVEKEERLNKYEEFWTQKAAICIGLNEYDHALNFSEKIPGYQAG